MCAMRVDLPAAARAALLRDASPDVQRAAAVAALLAFLGVSQAYNGGVSRTLRSIRRSAPLVLLSTSTLASEVATASWRQSAVSPCAGLASWNMAHLHERRAFAAALSAWLEEQSGLSLLTPEGEHADFQPSTHAMQNRGRWVCASARHPSYCVHQVSVC